MIDSEVWMLFSPHPFSSRYDQGVVVADRDGASVRTVLFCCAMIWDPLYRFDVFLLEKIAKQDINKSY